MMQSGISGVGPPLGLRADMTHEGISTSSSSTTTRREEMTDGESTATPSCERQRAGRRMRTSARSAGGTTETGKGTRGETGTGIERGSGGVKRSQTTGTRAA